MAAGSVGMRGGATAVRGYVHLVAHDRATGLGLVQATPLEQTGQGNVNFLMHLQTNKNGIGNMLVTQNGLDGSTQTNVLIHSLYYLHLPTFPIDLLLYTEQRRAASLPRKSRMCFHYQLTTKNRKNVMTYARMGLRGLRSGVGCAHWFGD